MADPDLRSALGRTMTDSALGEAVLGDEPDQTLPEGNARGRLLAASPPPERIGRYTIEGRLGAGAMGVVFAAHDTQADRPVAIKLLLSWGGEAERLRLYREAQALAQLSHPNVVQVFEVGTLEGRPYLVMELVDGTSLDRWIDAEPEPRDVRRIVDVFVQAGEGLAAAHAVGFVHRDFKPGNVRVGSDGRVRVLDFGLARVSTQSAGDDTEVPSLVDGEPLPPLWAQGLTRDGAAMGTPAYMSPEQLSRVPTTAASDQFSYCVALYEALYGQHPFAVPGQLHRLHYNVLTGELRAPPDRGVPPKIRAAIVRGLSVDPLDRWPSMDALLHELRAAVRPSPWARRLGVLAVVGTVATAAWLMARGSSDPAGACTGAPAKLAQVWGPSQRASVQQALEATALSYAEQTWVRVEQQLDRYAAAWSEAHGQACRAGFTDPRVLDQRMACLERQRDALGDQIEIFMDADATVVEQAVSAIHALPPPQRCLESAGGSTPPEDPRQAALLRRLERVHALTHSGKYRAARAEIEPILADSEAQALPAVEAHAQLARGEVEQHLGQFEAASRALERAYFLGRQLGDDRTAREAATRLVATIGVDLQDSEGGLEWARHAEVEVQRSDDPLARGLYLGALGMLHYQRGDHTQALQALQQGLQVQREVLGPQHLAIAAQLSDIGIVLRRLNRPQDSLRHHELALDIYEQQLGADHPEVAQVLRNLAAAQHALNRDDDAIASIRRSLIIDDAALGPDHASMVTGLNNLSVILSDTGRYEEAEAAVQRATALLRRAGNQPHSLGVLLGNLASVQRRQGKLQQAEKTHRQAVAVFEDAHLEDHPDFGHELFLFAAVLEQSNQLPEADATLRRALASYTRAPSSSRVVLRACRAHARLARVSLARGLRAEAIAHAEQGLAQLPSESLLPRDRAIMHFVLAQARWDDDPAARDQARGHARDAAAAASGLPPTEEHRPLLEQIEAWRAEHDPTAPSTR